jgi:hypothetical protein
MNRPLLVFAFFAAATAALAAQEASQSSPYSGVSNPPPDDTILTDTQEAPAKPPASHPLTQPTAAPVQQNYAAPVSQAAPTPTANPAMTGTDDGIVQAAQQPPSSSMPVLSNRAEPYDPDGDIVRPAPLGEGELAEGTTIRVRLLTGLSSTLTQQGETFRSRVASDVLQDGQVVIPTGAEISGRVVEVSKGSMGGHGSLMLRPETMTLPTGETYRLRAIVADAPGTHTKINHEGEIGPDSRLKRNSIEYGGAVGVGVVAGASLGGPAGALAGGLVGAGLVTVHLLMSHPQAHLEEGDVLMLTLTERMHIAPAAAQGQ